MSSDIDSTLSKAAQLLHDGEVGNAFALYESLLLDHPSDLRVIIGVAKSLCAKGEIDEAGEFIDECFEKFAHASTSATLNFLKGFTFEVKGLWQEAIKCYEACIYFDPKHFDALYNQGNIFLELGRYSEAMTRYEFATELIPTHSRLLNNAGIASVKLGQFAKGVAFFEASLNATPKFVEAVTNKAWTLLTMGLANEALEQFKELLELGQELNLQLTVSDAHKGCGIAYVELLKNSEALVSFTKAIQLDPNNPELLNNRGNVYKYLCQWESAIADLRQAIELQNDYAQARSNLGNVYKEMGEFEQALDEYQNAIQLQPGFAQAHLNKALLLLGQGQFDSGFQEYEWRWATPEYSAQVLQTSKPMWEIDKTLFDTLNGTSGVEPISAPISASVALETSTLRLLVWNEQGVGDDIYFVRFLPLIMQFVGRLIVRVDERLVPIFAHSFPGIHFVAENKQLSENEFDVHIPIASLARWGQLFLAQGSKISKFKSPPNSFLATSYLACPPKPGGETNEIIELKQSQNEFVIGISWKSLHPQSGTKRSLALEEFIQQLQSPEGSIKTINWVSLQYSEVSTEIKDAAVKTGVQVRAIEHLDAEHDLDEMARVMSACDLVISIDNTTAHMSAALGVKTWVLLPFTSDWRWQVVRDPVYGYSSARTFRQTDFNQWSAPLAEMADELEKLLN